ncbi:MAG: GNAT family N-acetyltransferase [Flavobacteriaceae bacterium]|nr:GNAT family N-acetyltransferase [Flavobacteriaceae bacterium]
MSSAIKIIRTDSSHEDFIQLVALLDADLAMRDGDEHEYYHQFNNIDVLKYTVVVYCDDHAIGCGAIKQFQTNSVEVKRMFTKPESRGKGIATQILLELEQWAKELGFQKSVLETGKRQPEAIALYTKNNYQIIPNYGQYIGIDNSLCFEKEL